MQSGVYRDGYKIIGKLIMVECNSPSPEREYKDNECVKLKVDDGKVIDAVVIGYDAETEYYTLQVIIEGKTRDIKVQKEFMKAKLVSPEEQGLKYKVGEWVNIYRNVYDDGKKTREKKKGRGFVDGFEKDVNKYRIFCRLSAWNHEVVLVSEATLDELNPKREEKDDTDKTAQIRHVARTTLQGGFGVKGKKS